MAIGSPILKKKAPAVQQQEPWEPFRLAAFQSPKGMFHIQRYRTIASLSKIADSCNHDRLDGVQAIFSLIEDLGMA